MSAYFQDDVSYSDNWYGYPSMSSEESTFLALHSWGLALQNLKSEIAALDITAVGGKKIEQALLQDDSYYSERWYEHDDVSMEASAIGWEMAAQKLEALTVASKKDSENVIIADEQEYSNDWYSYSAESDASADIELAEQGWAAAVQNLNALSLKKSITVVDDEMYSANWYAYQQGETSEISEVPDLEASVDGWSVAVQNLNKVTPSKSAKDVLVEDAIYSANFYSHNASDIEEAAQGWEIAAQSLDAVIPNKATEAAVVDDQMYSENWYSHSTSDVEVAAQGWELAVQALAQGYSKKSVKATDDEIYSENWYSHSVSDVEAAAQGWEIAVQNLDATKETVTTPIADDEMYTENWYSTNETEFASCAQGWKTALQNFNNLASKASSKTETPIAEDEMYSSAWYSYTQNGDEAETMEATIEGWATAALTLSMRDLQPIKSRKSISLEKPTLQSVHAISDVRDFQDAYPPTWTTRSEQHVLESLKKAAAFHSVNVREVNPDNDSDDGYGYGYPASSSTSGTATPAVYTEHRSFAPSTAVPTVLEKTEASFIALEVDDTIEGNWEIVEV